MGFAVGKSCQTFLWISIKGKESGPNTKYYIMCIVMCVEAGNAKNDRRNTKLKKSVILTRSNRF